MRTEREIRKSINEIRKKYGYTTRDKAFEHWAVEVITGLENQDAYEAAKYGGKNDKGIDAFIYEIEGDRTIRVFQMKYTEGNPTRSSFGPKAVGDLHQAYEWLSKAPLKKISNPYIQDAARDFRRGRKKHYNIEFILVIFGKLTREGRKQFNHYKQKFEKDNISLILYDYPRIVEKYLMWKTQASEDRIEDDVSLTLVGEEYFVKILDPDRNIRVLVASVLADELVDLFQKYYYKLFDLNVRYSLGKTDASSAMSKTLRDPNESRLFFAYNNGMTILCDDFEILDGRIIIKAPQIVNGCQTTVTLYLNRSDINESTSVLVRFINSQTEELSLKIAESTNTQNAVTHRDLRANDAIQRILQSKFDDLDPPIKYIRKRGEWKKLNKKEKQKYHIKGQRYNKIENVDIAKSFLSFMGKPIEARTKSKLLFVTRDDGFYHEIFSIDRSAEEYLLPYRVYEYVKARESKFKRERPADEDLRDLSEQDRISLQAESVILYATYVITGMIGYLIKKRYHGEDSSWYNQPVAMKLIESFDEWIEQIYDICKKTLIQYSSVAVGMNPNYNPSNELKKPRTYRSIITTLEAGSVDLSILPEING